MNIPPEAWLLLFVVIGFAILVNPKFPSKFGRKKKAADNRSKFVKICRSCGTVNDKGAVECKNHRCRANLTKTSVDRLVRSKA